MYCSNYIFMLDLTHGFNRLYNDNCKTRQETFKVRDLVGLILKTWRYIYITYRQPAVVMQRSTSRSLHPEMNTICRSAGENDN